MKLIKKSSMAALLGLFALTVAATMPAKAETNPFAVANVMTIVAADAHEDGKCGEGKMKDKAKGKCGEGKCGEGKAKAMAEGKCGEDKMKAHAKGKCGEGKCGEGKAKAHAEGKCGEDKMKAHAKGKCGEWFFSFIAITLSKCSMRYENKYSKARCFIEQQLAIEISMFRQ